MFYFLELISTFPLSTDLYTHKSSYLIIIVYSEGVLENVCPLSAENSCESMTAEMQFVNKVTEGFSSWVGS